MIKVIDIWNLPATVGRQMIDNSLDPAVVRPASKRWQSVHWRWPSGEDWIGLAVVFYLTVIIGHLFPHFWLAGLLVSLPVGALVIYVLRGLWATVIAGRIVRYFPPAVDIPPPPPEPEGETEKFVRTPSIYYPSLAFAKGQCGWVVLRLRIDAKGRVVAFKVGPQAPRRVFERSVASGLWTARLIPAERHAKTREATTVIVFPVEGKDTPDWARARLAALSPTDRSTAVNGMQSPS